MRALLRLGAAACFSLLLAGVGYAAESYPQKPIQLIIPVPPGGAADFIGRIVAQKLTDALEQKVLADNRPGAAGTIASTIVMNAKPDGYTLLLSSSTTHGTAPVVYKSVPFDSIKSFSHIGLVATVPAVLSVNASLPVKSVQEFVSYAKANPGKLNFGSSGAGSPLHLWGELFNSVAQVSLIHVPYKGAGPAQLDLIAGRIHAVFDALPSQIGNIQAGKTRPLAAMHSSRLSILPDVPTMAEAGYSGVEGGLWFGLSGPAGMPKEIVEKISHELSKIAAMPDVKDAFSERGIITTPMGPADYAGFIRSENVKYGTIAQRLGISLEF